MTQLIAVQGSSNIAAYGYDAAQRVLSIQFHSSATPHRYQDVPPELAADFEAADSKGKFFHQHIKGKFTSPTVAAAAAGT